MPRRECRGCCSRTPTCCSTSPCWSNRSKTLSWKQPAGWHPVSPVILSKKASSLLSLSFPPPLISVENRLFSLHPWSFSSFSVFTSFMSLRLPHSLSPGSQLIIRWQPSLRTHCCSSRPVAIYGWCCCAWTRLTSPLMRCRDKCVICVICVFLNQWWAVLFLLYFILPNWIHLIVPSILSKLKNKWQF